MTPETKIVASNDQLSSELAGKTVILNLASGNYYSFEGIGERVWRLIQKPRTFRELCLTITQEYDIEDSQCADDLRALLNQLAQENMIKIIG